MCLTRHLIFSIKTCTSFSAGWVWGVWVGKDFRRSPLVGCVVEVSTKLKVLEEGFLFPHFEKGVFAPTLS
jgi:hypothetical protein